MNFSNCHLDSKLLQGLTEAGYVACTDVQERVLSLGMGGSDLYVQSQTGTGKTAAYLVPLMQQMLAQGTEKRHSALILVPTRELAVQVEQEAQTVGKYTGLCAASFYGGVGYQQQEQALKKGVDLIIGTPGRVIDLEKSGTMPLKNIGFLIIDEADRMFDMGFYPDLRSLLAVLPKAEERQTMLFSATLNTWVKNLAWEYTIDAKEITIDADTITVSEIHQKLFHVAAEQKMSLLLGILRNEKCENVIIFCNTKKMTEIVAKRLRINGYAAEFLIGDLPQQKRLRIIEAFKAGKCRCLVATDVAARGIDVNDLAMVINYDLPNEAENYVHRIGRTARAGKTGSAYSLCSEQDVYSLPAIEKYIEAQVPSCIPCEGDFEQDVSADRYIRLDRDTIAGGQFGSALHRGEKSFRECRDSRRGSRTAKAQSRFTDKKRDRKRVQTDDSDGSIARKSTVSLENLSFEQRMAYYKNKYGEGLVKKNISHTVGNESESKQSSRVVSGQLPFERSTKKKRKIGTGIQKHKGEDVQAEKRRRKKARFVYADTMQNGKKMEERVNSDTGTGRKMRVINRHGRTVDETSLVKQRTGLLSMIKKWFTGT